LLILKNIRADGPDTHAEGGGGFQRAIRPLDSVGEVPKDMNGDLGAASGESMHFGGVGELSLDRNGG
jgi:hypothetical protein